MLRYILTAALGGALVYFLDPDKGKRRRHMARDRAAATARHTSRLVGTRVRYATSTAHGLAEKAAHSRDEEVLPLDEATLAHKVESEIFRDPAIPKGNININVEDGVVVLRGQLDRLEDIS